MFQTETKVADGRYRGCGRVLLHVDGGLLHHPRHLHPGQHPRPLDRARPQVGCSRSLEIAAHWIQSEAPNIACVIKESIRVFLC